MEIIAESDMKFVELIAVEFDINACSFRAFFSYKNSTTPVFAIRISYYQARDGIWKSFADIQEPRDCLVTATIYEKLRAKLQKISNSFIEQYKKGAKVDEKINHVISHHYHSSVFG